MAVLHYLTSASVVVCLLCGRQAQRSDWNYTMVRIDEGKCLEIASLLKRITIPPPEEEGSLQGLSREQLPNFYFLVVAICHQTSPVGGQMLYGTLDSGESCRGWDYLRKRLAERVTKDPNWIEPTRWMSTTACDLEELLADSSGRKTATGTERRAEIVQNLGSRCSELGLHNADELLARCEGWIVGSPSGGLYVLLSTFEGYRDPVRKKSSFFLELMRTQCQWPFRDIEHLGAPVDYHEVRGHLRLGTVNIQDAQLLENIQQRREVTPEQDLAIRTAVYGAIEQISREHGSTSPAVLHYLFWNTFRCCCSREDQHCNHCSSTCGLPSRYREAFETAQVHRCVFTANCASSGRPEKPFEHQHLTDYY
jgi:hypothetical protein